LRASFLYKPKRRNGGRKGWERRVGQNGQFLGRLEEDISEEWVVVRRRA